MYRIILFLLLIALAAAGAAWVADQTGDVVLSWGGLRATTSLPVFALALGVTIAAAIVVWSIVRALWRTPERIRRSRRERRHARGRRAITQGLLAIGHGDSTAARQHADVARRHAAHDPLALLLHAQSAQLDGDREGAQRAFRAMAEREDTRLLGLRGLFIEAQRADDPVAAVMLAEEALKLAPGSTWASHAVLGFRCAKGDWSGALAILDNNLASGLIDKVAYRRQRGVLLTARALELEKVDRDLSRESVVEAVKLAPTLVPAAVLASKYESEAHQVRRSMRIVETAWLAQPHPDLADAYAHVRLGDSARQRLVRIETLAAKAPGHIESALAIARAAVDASEFARARGTGAVYGGTDATGRDVDGGDRAHRTWRQRPGAGLDAARGTRAARSGLDRGWICQRSLAAGVAGVGPAGRLSMADAAGGIAIGQRPGDRILAVRGSDAGRGAAAPRRAAARGPTRASAACRAGQFSGPCRNCRTGARASASAATPTGRNPAGNPGAAVPRAPGSAENGPIKHSGRNSHRPRAGRSRDRRRGAER
jgi:HemY protein